jgi:hypothetical protein
MRITFVEMLQQGCKAGKFARAELLATFNFDTNVMNCMSEAKISAIQNKTAKRTGTNVAVNISHYRNAGHTIIKT